MRQLAALLLVLWAAPVAAQTLPSHYPVGPLEGRPFPAEKEPVIPPEFLISLMLHGSVALDLPQDPTGEVRMLYLYSPWAAGGTGANPWAQAQSLVDLRNQVLDNSQITTGRYTLVASAVIPIYTENETTGGLAWLSRPEAQPWVTDLRIAVGADCVTFINGDRACGQAYRPAPAGRCHAHVHRDCAASNLSDPHEGFHNANGNHDKANASCGTNCTGDAYAHAWPVGAPQWRSTLAYPGAGGQRVPFESNPNVLHNGHPTGVEGQANNARHISIWLPTLAAYQSVVTTMPAPLSLVGLPVARP